MKPQQIFLWVSLLILSSCSKNKMNWNLEIKNKTSETLYIFESTYNNDFIQTMSVGANDSINQKSMIVKVPYVFQARNINGDTIATYTAIGKYKQNKTWTVK